METTIGVTNEEKRLFEEAKDELEDELDVELTNKATVARLCRDYLGDA